MAENDQNPGAASGGAGNGNQNDQNPGVSGSPPAGNGAGKKGDTQNPGAASGGAKPGVPVKYRCKTKCHYGGRLHRVGDVITTDKEVPKHFEKITE